MGKEPATMMVRMDRDVVRKLKIHAAHSHHSMREVATKWIKERLIKSGWATGKGAK